jgi:RNA polymerase sigma-70 factor (ECF subfamily)
VQRTDTAVPPQAPAIDELAPLIPRILGADQRALGELFDRLSGRVYAVAMRVLSNAHDAEEVVGDVFHQVWTRAAQYSAERGSVTRWLLVIAYTRAIDLKRRHSDRDRTQTLHPDETEPAYPDREERVVSELLDAMTSGSAIHAALAGLKQEQRDLIGLAFLEGLSHQEIAERSGIPLGTVKSHIRRGLIELRGKLEPKGYGP